MNIPGFTAEASLYDCNVRYRSATDATYYGGLIYPASDLLHPDRPVLSLKPHLRSVVFDWCVWSYRCHWEAIYFDPLNENEKPTYVWTCGIERICY